MKALLPLLLLCLVAVSPARAEPSGTIVAFGDSITRSLVPGAWPSVLHHRLRVRFPKAGIAVVNASISGDRLLDGTPRLPAGLSRFEHDALGQKGVRTVIVLIGINDIGKLNLDLAAGKPDASKDDLAAQLVRGYRRLIDAAHARGVKILGGTLLPFEGAGYYGAAGEAVRQAVNRWIRSEGAFDAVIDFDAALRDPAHPLRLRPAYDSGDHLHPSTKGEAAMAAAVDLDALE